jgi:small-conductance mechanosensitive channel
MTPAPVVRVHELADNSVNLIARPWVRTADYWDVYWDLMRQVKERFDEEGVNIPFPQRDLHIPGAIEVRLAGTHATSPAHGSADRPRDGTRTHSTHEPGPAIADAARPDDTTGQAEEDSESN